MKPIQLVSWRRDFIAALARRLVTTTNGDLSRVLVIVPHSRPIRFLKAALADLPGLAKPCLMPRMLAFDGFIDLLAQDIQTEPLRRIGLLDQAGLLFQAVDTVRARGDGPLSRLPLERDRFLPWGTRLAGLLEELCRQDLDPGNLPYMEGEVIPWAAALLEQLGDIRQAYAQTLEEQNLTTFGLDTQRAARNLSAATARAAGLQIFLAGFYALSGAEEVIFRHLWSECGAEVLWHGDPAMAFGPSQGVHPAEAEHLAWRRDWGARVELLAGDDGDNPGDGNPGNVDPRADAGPDIRFVEGFDLHSQLSVLGQELAGLDRELSAAVVLPETGLLTPVLHHLPEQEVNISMGAPLDRSALAQLLELVLDLAENRVESPGHQQGQNEDKGLYPRQTLIALLRHPYVKMPALGRMTCLRPVFQHWEAHLRQGSPLADPWDFLPTYLDVPENESEAAAEALRLDLLDRFLTRFAAVASLEALGQSLADLAGFLNDLGGSLWRTHLLDAECLCRLVESIIPQLQGCLVSRDAYPQSVLFAVLRELLAAERVSFEPEPLTGLQVLGFLEARLLRFSRLYVLEAVEDLLPGAPVYDPLLPDPLRKLLGLPDSRERDHVAAYNFHRLIQGADTAVIFYQAGVKPGLLDSKSVRSRYVEELLWEREKGLGQRIERGDPVLSMVSFPAHPPDRDLAALPLTPAARERLETLVGQEGLSPSALDAYLRCPKAFFYRYLALLKQARPAPGEADQGRFGTLLHDVLKGFFESRLDTPLDLAALPELTRLTLGRDLDTTFARALETDPFFGHLPYDRRACLAYTGRERLARFLAAFPATRVLEVEKKITATLDFGGRSILFIGQPDRLDRREEGLILLDYKTGKVPRPTAGFWEDDELFEALDLCDPALDPDPDLLARLAKAVGSVQLPAYLHLFHQARPEVGEVLQAAWVELADKGVEAPLFAEKLSLAERRDILTGRIPALLAFLLRHMLGCTRFVPVRGPGCRWCEMSGPCGAPQGGQR